MKPDETPTNQVPAEQLQPVNEAKPVVPSSPDTINEQWQTKADYGHAQAVVSTSKLTRYVAIAFAVSLLMYYIISTTSLGDIGSFTGTGSRDQIARPLVGIATVAVLVSYFFMVISGIATSRGRATKRTSSIVGLVVGGILVLNPLGFVMVAFAVNCNFQSCSGS